MTLYGFDVWAGSSLDQASATDRKPLTASGDGIPDLSVVIVNWNTKDRLRACLCSLEQHLTSLTNEVIVVDNASGDGSAEMVEQHFPAVNLIRNHDNVGFGRANNQAMRTARGRWLVLLNSDTVLIDDSVADLFQALDRDRREGGRLADVGVAHCRLIFPDGRLQHSTYRFPTLRKELFEALGLYKLTSPQQAAEVLLAGYWDYAEERDVDWVAGSFMLLPREVFEVTGGFDERLFMYGEDLEWCYRIQDHGWRVRFFPRAAIIHYGHESAKIKWGDQFLARCLETERDVYAARHGRAAAEALLLVRLCGRTLRLIYYAVRARLPGRHAATYEGMLQYAAMSTRALVSILLTRR